MPILFSKLFGLATTHLIYLFATETTRANGFYPFITEYRLIALSPSENENSNIVVNKGLRLMPCHEHLVYFTLLV